MDHDSPPPSATEQALELHLRLSDPQVVTELLRLPEGPAREAHARRALKIGLLALKHVRGEIDGDTVRREGERILSAVEGRLEAHDRALHARLGQVLKDYFDPDSGRFAQRVKGLVADDGDLAAALRRAVGQEDSDLVKTLRAHIGPESPLMKTLSPSESEGLLQRLSAAVRSEVEFQRDKILEEFDLNRRESALARMRREMLEVLAGHSKDDAAFREAVLATLGELRGRRQEADRSTRHGDSFEEDLFAVVQERAQAAGDVATWTGRSVGLIPNCRVGDVVVELGPDHAAAGARIVVEAKEDRSYTLAKARSELEVARRNRGAAVGLFVFSCKTVPAGLVPFQRLGSDVFLVWDAADPESDVWLEAGLEVARALCTRVAGPLPKRAADFEKLERAVLSIEKQAGMLDEIATAAKTIDGANERIRERVRIAQKKIRTQVMRLNEMLGDLRDTLGEEG